MEQEMEGSQWDMNPDGFWDCTPDEDFWEE